MMQKQKIKDQRQKAQTQKNKNIFKHLICVFYIWSFIFGFSAFAERLIKQMDFIDAPVIEVVDTLARQSGLDVVISGDKNLVSGKRTTLSLKNITAEQAIEHVLAANGLNYEKKGRIILISTLPQNLNSSGPARVISLKYIPAPKIAEILSKIFPGIKACAGGGAGSLVITGDNKSAEQAAALAALIDKPVAQVLIESQVLELSESDSVRLGLSFGKEAGVFKFITNKENGHTYAAADLETTLNSLIGEGRAKVIAAPKIAALDNHKAVINIGSRIPYSVPVNSNSSTAQWTVEYIDAGVKLEITSQIGSDGLVTSFIQPEVSSVSEWRTTAAGEFPVITTRNAQSTLRVKDGETIVVGGLMSESERENISRVPIFGYIPLLGWLFQNKTFEKSKTEIVFFITPHIIN